MAEEISYHYFASDTKKIIDALGKDKLIDALSQMMMIRHLEMRAEAAYQQGKIGGFFHAYTGQEAIQTAAVLALGKNNWYTTTYRCHALALLLGATPKEVMAELYGKATGNAKGRGGSMHLYTEQMLGGFGIVGGHIPVATGAGFAINYLQEKKVSICFLGDGAVAQGAFHEALNLASLWDIPCIYVIENNHWGMGTAASKAICVQPMAEKIAPSYEMKGYTFDGMDFFNCYEGFSHVYKEVLKEKRPVLIEAITERFKGHSISDPALYRSKEEMKKIMEKEDPIFLMKGQLKDHNILNDEEYEKIDKEKKEMAIDSMDYAEKSPDPDPMTLEEGVII